MTVSMPDGRKEFYQFDTGQFLHVSYDVDRIDFTFRESGNIVYGVFSKNSKVTVPDVLLQNAGVLDMLVMGKNGKGITTYERMEIPVIERPMPPGYLVTENGAYISYGELEGLLGELGFLSTSGGEMHGNINMKGRAITGLVDPVGEDEAVRKSWAEYRFMKLQGDNKVSGRYTGFQKPVADDEPATKKYADDLAEGIRTDMEKKRKTYSATMSDSWVGESAPYTQEVAVDGILESDIPHITPVYDQDVATARAQMDNWRLVSFGVSEDGFLRFTCLYEKPTVQIPIQIEVMR